MRCTGTSLRSTLGFGFLLAMIVPVQMRLQRPGTRKQTSDFSEIYAFEAVAGVVLRPQQAFACMDSELTVLPLERA